MDLLAAMARDRGRQFVSWGWCATALAVSANIHLSVVHENVPLIEYAPPSLYPGSRIRAELAGPEPVVRNGKFELPTSPGLGVEVDEQILQELRIA
jgi:L-alanine-DL-glutamate epimerase-like enolase superfamily enzyme